MLRPLYTLILLLYSGYCLSQSAEDTAKMRHTVSISTKKAVINAEQNNHSLSLPTFLRGVRYATIEMNEEEQAVIDAKGSVFLKNFADYLKGIGIEYVAYTTTDKKKMLQTVASLCDIVRVTVKSGLLKDTFIGHRLSFESCVGDKFDFSSETPIYNDQFLIDKMFSLWESMYNQKNEYHEKYRLSLYSRPTAWQYDSLKNYLQATTDPIEGIFERLLLGNANDRTRYTIAILKNKTGNGYEVLYLKGATNYTDWLPYELIGEIFPSATHNIFSVRWYLPDKTLDDQVYMSVDAVGVLHFSFTKSEQETRRYFKTFPKRDLPQVSPSSTGSGVAISSAGYIITNYHVVEGGTIFEVQGKQNGVPKTYNATLVAQDIGSDLAVLKINSFDFKTLPPVPFTLKTTLAIKGEEVFTLGFPLSKQLGTESKYTTGNISAESGYQGDPSSYQTSVSVHPGNSGGGLFDKQGNLVGFVRAKLADTETITYAIKARNVMNLLDLLPESIEIPVNNTLKDKPLEEQIPILENFVFFIRVYN